MTMPRIKNLHFGRKIKKKRKLTRRKITRRQRGGAAFLYPILVSSIAPVLSGITGNVFRMMYVKKKKVTRRKNKK